MELFITIVVSISAIVSVLCFALGVAIWLLVILPILALATILVSPFLPRKKPLPTKDCCPACGSPLHPLRSQFMKMCGSCDYQEPWELKPGQKPLIGSNRDTRK